MDPVSFWILVLALGWVIRSLVEDGFAAARGHPSPRIARRRERQHLALQRAAITGTPPLTVAISSRLAYRVANPPDRRALAAARDYLDQVIADGFEDARTRHEDRRHQRTPPPPRSKPAPAADWPDPDIHDVEWFDTPDNAPPNEGAAPRPSGRHADNWPGQDRPPGPLDSTPPPAPAPVPEPTRKDHPPMTDPNTINGDVGSPAEALAYCEGALGLNAACSNEIDVALANLDAAGLGQGFLAIIGGGLAAADGFDGAVKQARVRYADHVATHADLSSDPDLRNTLLRYLSAARS